MDRIGDSIYKAARQSKVPNVINLSSIGAQLPSGTGPIAGLHRQEERLNQLDANVLHLRPTFFHGKFFGGYPNDPRNGNHGITCKSGFNYSNDCNSDIERCCSRSIESSGF